jgi:quercetin dioxygenase-like cupin family protein
MMTPSQLKDRFIPFSSLRYSTEAFIDYCIPECSPKKNYALIGPGVSQNPNQPVSLREKHGFQVGGVSMPPGKTNPPHMHFTAEVFMCTKGHWDLQWGFNPDPLKARLGPGDIASVPTWIYRGFQNVGEDEGFMFTALGQDDTGGILWGPQTLEAARALGVHLTEDYRIIDETAGQIWDSNSMKRLQPMTTAEISQLKHWPIEAMMQRVVRHSDLDWRTDALLDSVCASGGAQMAPVIGMGISESRSHSAPIHNSHGFSIEWLRIPAGGHISAHALKEKQVLSVYQGSLAIYASTEIQTTAQLMASDPLCVAHGHSDAWDSYAMPGEVWRCLRNVGDTAVTVLLMTAGDARKRIHWSTDAMDAATHAGYSIDANGYVALKQFTDRSQR